MNQILQNLRSELISGIDEQTRKSSQHFFKEKINFYGVKTNVVIAIAGRHFATIKNKSKTEIFALCEELWKSSFLEESFVACNWSYQIRKAYKPIDFVVFEKWVSCYVNNWASCDTLCNHTVGEFIEMYPEFLAELKKWAISPNRWMRRAAAVTLIIPARKGKFLTEIFQIADILLMDTDDLVQKGYGWMLKAASQAHQVEVFEYIMNHKTQMPRTALRYAIEKMPPELRAKAMQKP